MLARKLAGKVMYMCLIFLCIMDELELYAGCDALLSVEMRLVYLNEPMKPSYYIPSSMKCKKISFN